MAGFASVLEGLTKVKTLLDLPFVDALKNSAEVLTAISKAVNNSAEFFARLRDEGLASVDKKEKVADLVKDLDELHLAVFEPNRVQRVGQLRTQGERQVHQLQTDLRNLFKTTVLTLHTKMADYRDPDSVMPIAPEQAEVAPPPRLATFGHGRMGRLVEVPPGPTVLPDPNATLRKSPVAHHVSVEHGGKKPKEKEKEDSEAKPKKKTE